MKPASKELLALYATRQFMSADAYTFWGGNLGTTVLRFCSGDQDLTIAGNLFSAGRSTGPFLDRKDNKAKCHWKIGTDVDQLVFDMIPGTFMLFGQPLITAIKLGYFDGAFMMLEKVPMPWGAYGDTTRGTIRYFVGRLGPIDTGRSIFTFSVNSHLELLNLQLPRNLYQATCVNNLGDTACGVNLASYAFNGTVLTGSTTSQIRSASSPFSTDLSGAFGAGKIVFTSGANSGLSMSVSLNTSGGAVGVLDLLYEMPSPPSAGDTFTAYYGCDKTLFETASGSGTISGNVISAVATASLFSVGQALYDTGSTLPLGVIIEINPEAETITLSINPGEAGSISFTAIQNGCVKFANQARYRAERLVPQPINAV